MQQMDANDHRPTDCFRVYAIATRSAVESALHSNQFRGLGYLEVYDLVAITSAVPEQSADCDLTADRLTAFSDRLTELHQAFDMLPFRYTRAATKSDIVSFLREHRDAYQANLNHIAGCTEINARWASDDNSSSVSSSTADSTRLGSPTGGNYLRAKHRSAALERESAIELANLATAIGQRIGIPGIESRSSLRRIRSAEQNSILVFGLEVLIKRKEAEQYLQALSETRYGNHLPTIATGPWPPFSFVKDVNSAIVKAPFCTSATAEPVQKRAIFSGKEAAS